MVEVGIVLLYKVEVTFIKQRHILCKVDTYRTSYIVDTLSR